MYDELQSRLYDAVMAGVSICYRVHNGTGFELREHGKIKIALDDHLLIIAPTKEELARFGQNSAAHLFPRYDSEKRNFARELKLTKFLSTDEWTLIGISNGTELVVSYNLPSEGEKKEILDATGKILDLERIFPPTRPYKAPPSRAPKSAE